MSQTPTLHVLCGKLASGKTTLARRIAYENGAVSVSEDVWLSRLCPEEIATFEDYLVYDAERASGAASRAAAD
jgi:predicted kinase